MVALTLALSPAERMQLEHLSPEAKQDYHYWRRLLAPILRQRRGVERALREIATQAGQPYATVRKRYYRAKSDGLLGLLDRRLCGPLFWKRKRRNATCPVSKCKGLHELWKKLCEENQRKSKPEYQRLVQMWKNRHPDIAAIPEFSDFPGWPKLPSGWTYENLMRYGPTSFELDAARVGPFFASRNQPLVYTTRKGLYVGSHYMMDDKWNDLFVNSFAEMKHGRPLEVYSFDLFAAKKLRKAVRVRTKDADGHYKGVAEVMSRFIFAATLYLDGYSPRGTQFVLEHGTAHIADGVLELVHEATGGAVTASLSGMQGDPAHIGLYPGLVRGNPHHKAALESNNSYEHNMQGALPGQTGKDVDHRPEELHGRLDYNATLLAAYAELPPEKAALLDFPILELNQYLDLAGTVEALIANTREHELEGWIESGNVLQAYRWGDQLLLETQLTPEQRAKIPLLLESGLLDARPVKMTRQEVFNRGARDLVRIPGWLVCSILGDDLAREATLSANEFAIRDVEIGPGVYRYEPIITTSDGRTELLRDGETYQVFINPFALGALFVRDAKGRYLGEAKQIYAPCRGDDEAVHRAMGEKTKREAALLAPFRRRHAGKAAEKLARHENNAGVVQGEHNAVRSATREKNKTAIELLSARRPDRDDPDA